MSEITEPYYVSMLKGHGFTPDPDDHQYGALGICWKLSPEIGEGGDGIAEVTPAYVMVLVDSAENPEDIDKNRAEAARIRAEERLQHKQSMHEYYQSKIALDRAMQRLQTAAKYKR